MLREQSHAEVQVERVLDGCEERLVTCGSWEPPENEYCAAAEGMMMCANRVVLDKSSWDTEGRVLLRILAPSNQLVAVLGVKNNIIRLSFVIFCKFLLSLFSCIVPE